MAEKSRCYIGMHEARAAEGFWLPSFLYRGGVGCFRGRLAEFFVVGGMFCVRLAGMADFCQADGVS